MPTPRLQMFHGFGGFGALCCFAADHGGHFVDLTLHLEKPRAAKANDAGGVEEGPVGVRFPRDHPRSNQSQWLLILFGSLFYIYLCEKMNFGTFQISFR